MRATVDACAERGVEYLTLFAFSSENWRRPAEEVSLLMQLFLIGARARGRRSCTRNGVRLKVVGDTSALRRQACATLIEQAERLHRRQHAAHAHIAANYGGRWDILQAMTAG